MGRRSTEDERVLECKNNGDVDIFPLYSRSYNASLANGFEIRLISSPMPYYFIIIPFV